MRTYLKTLFTVLLLILTGVNTAQAQQQCTAFETEVSCDTDTGRWNVTLSNTARALFAPGEVQISTPNSAHIIHQDPNTPMQIARQNSLPNASLTQESFMFSALKPSRTP